MIELRRLTKRYGEATVVREVSLTIAQGELLVLVGGSGSGKTTTLKMINRLIEPTSGEVWIDGEPTAAVEEHLLRRKIGYVFQKIGLFPHMSVADNVAIPLTLAGWNRARIDARVAEMLEMVDLVPSIGLRVPRELSGGQQQRVGFARALAAEPRALLTSSWGRSHGMSAPPGSAGPPIEVRHVSRVGSRSRLVGSQSILPSRRRVQLRLAAVT